MDFAINCTAASPNTYTVTSLQCDCPTDIYDSWRKVCCLNSRSIIYGSSKQNSTKNKKGKEAIYDFFALLASCNVFFFRGGVLLYSRVSCLVFSSVKPFLFNNFFQNFPNIIPYLSSIAYIWHEHTLYLHCTLSMNANISEESWVQFWPTTSIIWYKKRDPSRVSIEKYSL